MIPESDTPRTDAFEEHLAQMLNRGHFHGGGEWNEWFNFACQLEREIVMQRDAIIEECARAGWNASLDGAPVGYVIRLLKKKQPQGRSGA